MLGVSYYSSKQIDISAQKTHISKSILIANELLKKDNSSSLDFITNSIKKITGYRVTIIDENGTVLSESDKNKSEMVNHINRPEIMQSMREAIGTEIRHSTTLEKDFIYAAIKTSHNHSTIFLRLASEVSEYEKHLYSLWYQIATIFLIALIISIFLSYRINKKIEAQISNIADYLIQLERKNFKAVIKPAFAKEFYSIADILTVLTKKLEKQENQKRKYTTKLKLKNRQATEIIEAIAHEFKNPVAAVMGYTETVMSEPNMDHKIVTKFLEKAHSNANLISKMIDRLSLSLKLENNTVEVRPENFEITHMLTDIKEQLLQKYKKREIKIECENISVYADRTLLQMAIVNLMDNALKYSDREIIIKASYQDEKTKFEVIDFGMGIPEREIENITKKFYRVGKNGWDNSLGLGLALVKYILKLHESELDIKSKVALGSSFSFLISKKRSN